MIKITKLIAVLIVTMIGFGGFAGCGNSPENKESDYKKITAEEAKNRMDENKGVIIVDVRTLDEFKEGHIKGAILIPNETINDAPPELLPDLNAEILVYCRSGNRSQQAAQKLVDLGYTNVYDFGGIIDWPYDTITE